jgi:serine/threonine-protein kinase
VPFSVGDLIDGHYRVEQRFAGGMGFVYVVLDEVMGKRFAIKQLAEQHAHDKVLCERFRREASTWLLLDYHPHIVQAHSYLPRPEGPMLILEYVDGPSLELLLRVEKRLCPAQAVAYARQFCQAMAHAHSRVIAGRGSGVLHRDIKPANILIARANQLKVTDFGLAKIVGDAAITSEGQYVGTVAYSSPEQLRAAGEVTRASDVYSFGAVLYQMFSGQPPFQAASAAELYYAIQTFEPTPLLDLCPGLNPGLARVVMQCLDKDPARRFHDFVELEFTLGGFEPIVRDRRDRACANCGFITQRRLTKCVVCGGLTAADRAKLAARLAAAAERTGAGVRAAAPPPGAISDEASVPQRAEPPPTAPDRPTVLAPASGMRQSLVLEPDKEYLVELRGGGAVRPWQLDRAGYTLGRDENMKIRLDDPAVARYQLFLVRLPCGWLAMDPQPNSLFEVNGWDTKQRVLQPADLIRVGATWLAFAGPPGKPEPLPPIPGHWLERSGPRAATVRSGGSVATQVQSQPAATCALELPGGRKFCTRGQPLRIGSSSLCEVPLDDAAAAPFQALVAWQEDGPHLINLTGDLVRLVGGQIVRDRLLQDGDLIQIGATPVRVRVEGDPQEPARMRDGIEGSGSDRFALTILTGSQKGQTAVLPHGQAIVLGRHPECDVLVMPDPHVSRRHLELTAGSTGVEVKDLGRRSGFFLNQVHYPESAIARLGDVLVVGKTSLLVHYELATE